MPSLTAELDSRRDALLRLLESCERVVVAFSAGVDSTVLAKAAFLACGDRALAVTGESPSLASGEVAEARRLAEQIGIAHEVLQTSEFASEDYRSNQPNRCYFCKDTLYQSLIAHLADRDAVIVNGANLDDTGDHRPGMLAAAEHRVRSPFIEVGLGKADIRELARAWNLPVWDKPASPCLSSRIAYGVEVTPERVSRVDQAEQFLRRQCGLRELRVRLLADEVARIEVPLDALPRLIAADVRTAVVAHLRTLGFRYITLDLEGLRSGSLNNVIPVEQLALSATRPDRSPPSDSGAS